MRSFLDNSRRGCAEGFVACVNVLSEALKTSVASRSASQGSKRSSWLWELSKTVIFAWTRVFDCGAALDFGLTAVVILAPAWEVLESMADNVELYQIRCFKVATVREEHVAADATACLTVSACACRVGEVIAMMQKRV